MKSIYLKITSFACVFFMACCFLSPLAEANGFSRPQNNGDNKGFNGYANSVYTRPAPSTPQEEPAAKETPSQPSGGGDYSGSNGGDNGSAEDGPEGGDGDGTPVLGTPPDDGKVEITPPTAPAGEQSEDQKIRAGCEKSQPDNVQGCIDAIKEKQKKAQELNEIIELCKKNQPDNLQGCISAEQEKRKKNQKNEDSWWDVLSEHKELSVVALAGGGLAAKYICGKVPGNCLAKLKSLVPFLKEGAKDAKKIPGGLSMKDFSEETRAFIRSQAAGRKMTEQEVISELQEIYGDYLSHMSSGAVRNAPWTRFSSYDEYLDFVAANGSAAEKDMGHLVVENLKKNNGSDFFKSYAGNAMAGNYEKAFFELMDIGDKFLDTYNNAMMAKTAAEGIKFVAEKGIQGAAQSTLPAALGGITLGTIGILGAIGAGVAAFVAPQKLEEAGYDVDVYATGPDGKEYDNPLSAPIVGSEWHVSTNYDPEAGRKFLDDTIGDVSIKDEEWAKVGVDKRVGIDQEKWNNSIQEKIQSGELMD